jgi:hypothetical protein
MKTTKSQELIYNNIDINEMVKTLNKHRDEVLENFSKAYLAETGLMPSEVELVSQVLRNDKTIETVYFFRKKPVT